LKLLIGEVPHILKKYYLMYWFFGDKKEPVPFVSRKLIRILGKVDELAESDEELNVPFL
jgi:transcription termination/antitermination protein NusG